VSLRRKPQSLFAQTRGVIPSQDGIPVCRFLSFLKSKRQKGERLITKMDCGFRRNDNQGLRFINGFNAEWQTAKWILVIQQCFISIDV
jgi:hypothetical protein